LIPVGFGYGDGDEFFLWEWVWDSETRPRPVAIPKVNAMNLKSYLQETEFLIL